MDGATTCDAGVCTRANDWFSQCLPATTTSTTSTLTTPASKTTTTSASVTCFTNLPTYTSAPVKASTPNTPVYSLQMRKRSDGRAVLNSPGYSYLLLLSANTAYLIEPGPGCQYKTYLNVYDNSNSPTASYKDLKFEIGVLISDYWSRTDWGVTSSSPWGAQDWFMACPTSVTNEYLLYLQTGSDIPYGQNCTLTQIKRSIN